MVEKVMRSELISVTFVFGPKQVIVPNFIKISLKSGDL